MFLLRLRRPKRIAVDEYSGRLAETSSRRARRGAEGNSGSL